MARIDDELAAIATASADVAWDSNQLTALEHRQAALRWMLELLGAAWR